MTPLYVEARMAVNMYHILGLSGELQQHVNFPTIPEPGSVRSRCGRAGLISLEAYLLDMQTVTFSPYLLGVLPLCMSVLISSYEDRLPSELSW